jgi:hypothetical protein
MAIGLGDIYEKLKELVTITDKVRENTDRIVKLEEEFRAYREESRLSDAQLKGDIKTILNRLDMKEEISELKVRLAEHIAASEKAKA